MFFALDSGGRGTRCVHKASFFAISTIFCGKILSIRTTYPPPHDTPTQIKIDPRRMFVTFCGFCAASHCA